MLRDGGVRLAHRDHADPQPVERAQRDRARRARAASPRCRSASRSSCSRRRCRCASRSSSSASTSSARATCSSPTTRTTAAATSPTTTCSRPCSPTTADGGRRMVLIASIQCHHGDTGGGVPGGYNVTATDIWGEGVRWPVVKVIDRGVERRDVLYALQANNRIPSLHRRPARADRRRAARRAAARARSSSATAPTTVEASVDSMIDYAARRFREEVAAWPDGVYEADAYVDHDPLGNPDVHLHVKVTVAGDTLTIDFTGSDTRPEIQAWSTYGNTRGYTVGQIAAMMDPEIPKNEGFFEQIKLVVPKGCVLNPDPGKPVSRGHAPPRRRRRRGHRGRDAARAARARGAADLQDRHPDDHHRRRPAHRRVVHRPLGRGVRGLVQRVEGHGRVGRAQRVASATSGRRPPRSTSRCTRTSSGAATTAPTPAARASGAASAAATTRRKCASTPRSTRTSSA